MALVTGEQVLNEGGNALGFLTVELGIFEEGDVSRSPDSFYVAEYAEGVATQFFEVFAGGLRKHGGNYINFRNAHNSTSVLRQLHRSPPKK